MSSTVALPGRTEGRIDEVPHSRVARLVSYLQWKHSPNMGLDQLQRLTRELSQKKVTDNGSISLLASYTTLLLGRVAKHRALSAAHKSGQCPTSNTLPAYPYTDRFRKRRTSHRRSAGVSLAPNAADGSTRSTQRRTRSRMRKSTSVQVTEVWRSHQLELAPGSRREGDAYVFGDLFSIRVYFPRRHTRERRRARDPWHMRLCPCSPIPSYKFLQFLTAVGVPNLYSERYKAIGNFSVRR